MFHEKLFKSLKIHCYSIHKMSNKNYKLVILTTLVDIVSIRQESKIACLY